MFLAGPKVKNSPASKLASNFRPFDPGIIKYGTIEIKNGNPAEFVSAGFPFPFLYYCDLTSFQSAL